MADFDSYLMMSRRYHAAVEEHIIAFLDLHPELTIHDIALVEWSSVETADGRAIYKRHFKIVRKEEVSNV